MDWSLYGTGFFWGAVSAVSLPLGALIGLWAKPSNKITSALMAFGAGALLFALTTELFGHALHAASDTHGKIIDPWIIGMIMIGAGIGGLLFQALNEILNNQGAFLRKGVLIKKHITRIRRRYAKKFLRSLSQIKILHSLPAEEAIEFIPYMKKAEFRKGETIFEEGDEGDRLYFIISGKVNISRRANDRSQPIATLGHGDIFGEIALFISEPRNATAAAQTSVEVWQLLKSDFEYLLNKFPSMKEAFYDIVKERIQNLAQQDVVLKEKAKKWEREALDRLDNVSAHLTEETIQEVVEEHNKKGGAALSIWLGIALDSIPESLVIGMLVVTAAAENTTMSLAFIAGVFLANLPEAMSSAVTMRKNNETIKKIFGMWMSLCILTGTGAFLGALIFPPHPEGTLLYLVFCIEGIAAGAMLTMIAETMLPEAFEQGGGPIVGLSTLIGFLAALSVKLIH